MQLFILQVRVFMAAAQETGEAMNLGPWKCQVPCRSSQSPREPRRLDLLDGAIPLTSLPIESLPELSPSCLGWGGGQQMREVAAVLSR